MSFQANFMRGLFVAVALSLLPACSATPAEERGYRFFVESVISRDGPDQEESDLNQSVIDIADCVNDANGNPTTIYVDAASTANLVVEVIEGFEFQNGLTIRITHIVQDFIPVSGVDVDDPNSLVDLPVRTYQFSEDGGPVVNVGDGDGIEQEISLPGMDIRRKREFETELENLGYDSLDNPQYIMHYEIWGKDNYGNVISTVVEGVVTIGSYIDECN